MKDPQLCFEEALVKKVEFGFWVCQLSGNLKTLKPRCQIETYLCVAYISEKGFGRKRQEIISIWLQLHTQSWISCLGGEYRVRGEEGLRFTHQIHHLSAHRGEWACGGMRESNQQSEGNQESSGSKKTPLQYQEHLRLKFLWS